MRRRFSVPSALVALTLLIGAPGYGAHDLPTAGARSKRHRQTPCPNQRYLVQGSPVLPGEATPEAILITGDYVAIGSACAETIAKLAVRARGTRVRARWPSCAGFPGRVKLAAIIDPACEAMTGIVKVHRLKLRTRFSASRTTGGGRGGDDQADGAVITVDTTTDALGDGLCSFQEAVQAANTGAIVDACPGGILGLNNTIAFDIPGGGRHTIPIATVTQITSSITIDGSTQPGYAGVPLIHLTGVVEDLLRFSVEATGSALKYLMLTNTNGGGLIDGATALFYSHDNEIVGNYFNTDGVTSIGPHGAGLLFDTSTNNVIGGTTPEARNLFGGQTGIFLQDSYGNLVEGNYFGLQADGNTAIEGLPRDGNGIQIFNHVGTATANTIRRNVITGFLAGVNMFQGANRNVVQGNHIGVAADGVTARSNGIGVLLYGAPDNTIGGATVADRNVISGNGSANIHVQNYAPYGADDNVIEGNSIGPDVTGRRSVTPNALFGIFLFDGASGNVIRRNVIAGSDQGIYIGETSSVAAGSSENCIQDNSLCGVNNLNPAGAPFVANWWGDATGPRYSGQAAGQGDWVFGNVAVSPFLTSEPATCSGGAGAGQLSRPGLH